MKKYTSTIVLAIIVLTSGAYVYAQVPDVQQEVIQEQPNEETVKYPDGIYNEIITPEIIEEAKMLLKKNQDTYEITRRLDRIIEILENK